RLPPPCLGEPRSLARICAAPCPGDGPRGGGAAHRAVCQRIHRRPRRGGVYGGAPAAHPLRRRVPGSPDRPGGALLPLTFGLACSAAPLLLGPWPLSRAPGTARRGSIRRAVPRHRARPDGLTAGRQALDVELVGDLAQDARDLAAVVPLGVPAAL